MNEIINKVYDYNSIVVDLANYEDWDRLGIPNNLINKRTKCEYEIFKSILEYVIEIGEYEKPTNIIIDNIYNTFFKVEQLIPIQDFKTYISYICHSRKH